MQPWHQVANDTALFPCVRARPRFTSKSKSYIIFNAVLHKIIVVEFMHSIQLLPYLPGFPPVHIGIIYLSLTGGNWQK